VKRSGDSIEEQRLKDQFIRIGASFSATTKPECHPDSSGEGPQEFYTIFIIDS
jgi:hypothetical protein